MRTTDILDPLEAIYIYVTAAHDTLGLIFDTDTTPVPQRDLKAGWSLIGVAVNPEEWPGAQSNFLLASIEEDAEGLRGYAQVVSPLQYIDSYYEEYYYGECDFYTSHNWWSFEQDGWARSYKSSEQMVVWGGYWVFMEHADTLAGLSYTPVTYYWD